MRKQKRFAVIQPHPTFCGAKCAGKSAKKVLRNNSGFSYILICVILWFAVMLLLAGLEYAAVVGRVKQEKTWLKQTADGVVIEYATRVYDAVKQGTRYADALNPDALVGETYRALGFGDDNTARLTRTEGTENPRVVLILERPEVTAVTADGFGVKVQCRVKVPFTVLGRTVSVPETVMEIESVFSKKWED